MRLEQLEFLIAVADNKSITRAAASLFVAQPTLSSSINSLEKELGFAIFCRSQKGVTLTSAGEEVYREAQQIISAVRKWDRFSEKQSAPIYDISIAYTAAANGFLNKIVDETTAMYPNYRLFFNEFSSKQILQELVAGKCQIGICGATPAREEVYRKDVAKFGWKMDLMCEDIFHIMISSQNPLSRKDVLGKEELENIPLAMMPQPLETVAQAYFKLFFSKRISLLS